MDKPDIAAAQAPFLIARALDYLTESWGVFRNLLPESNDTSWQANSKRCELLAVLVATSRSYYVRQIVDRRLREANPIQIADDLREPTDGVLVPISGAEHKAFVAGMAMLAEALGPEEGEPS